MISKLILGNYDTVIACKTEKGSVWQKTDLKLLILLIIQFLQKSKVKKL